MKPKDLFKSVHLVFVSMVLYLRSLIIQTTEVNCSLKSLSTRLDPHPFPVPLGRWAGACWGCVPGANGVTCAVLSVSSSSGFAKARVPLPIQRKEPVTQRSPLLVTVSLDCHGSTVGETTICLLWMPGRSRETGERKRRFCLVFLVLFLMTCYQAPKSQAIQRP